MLDVPPQIQGLSEEETKKLFDIDCGFGEDRKSWEKMMDIIKKKYKDEILNGLYYNNLMPCGNTYFHAIIANDMPYKTLSILKTIDEWVWHDKGRLAKLVPFSQLDNYIHRNGELVKKNFLMLAIAKKYEPVKNSDGSVKTCKDVYETLTRNNFIDKKLNHSYFTVYQEDDTKLIKWLIEKAPDDCIYQEDGEGYNLIDYAFMKMDIEILAELLKRGGEELLNGSKSY